MWGSMFVGPRMAADGVPVTDEHAYYTKEFSAEERAEGKDSAAVLFAAETARTERSVRGGGMTPSASMTSLKSAGEAAERANAAPAEKA